MKRVAKSTMVIKALPLQRQQNGGSKIKLWEEITGENLRMKVIYLFILLRFKPPFATQWLIPLSHRRGGHM